MKNRRAGFTMIELIFVIVIIGILAAVALPRLAATRDDATASKMVANIRTCISDVTAAFTATGTEAGDSSACNAANSEGCFSLNGWGDSDGDFTVVKIGSGTACNTAATVATTNNLLRDYSIGGTTVTY